MSEVEQVVVEQEDSLIVDHNPIAQFIDVVQGGNFNDAKELFDDILGDKVQQSLDAEKVSVADQIFNGVEPEEMEIDDAEVDAMLDNEVEEEISTEIE